MYAGATHGELQESEQQWPTGFTIAFLLKNLMTQAWILSHLCVLRRSAHGLSAGTDVVVVVQGRLFLVCFRRAMFAYIVNPPFYLLLYRQLTYVLMLLGSR